MVFIGSSFKGLGLEFNDFNGPLATKFLTVAIGNGICEGLFGMSIKDFLLDFLDGVALFGATVVKGDGDGEFEVHWRFLYRGKMSAKGTMMPAKEPWMLIETSASLSFS
jgi:hypothetical protein